MYYGACGNGEYTRNNGKQQRKKRDGKQLELRRRDNTEVALIFFGFYHAAAVLRLLGAGIGRTALNLFNSVYNK